MLRFSRALSIVTPYSRNISAAMVMMTALGTLVISFHPQPAGAHLGGGSSSFPGVLTSTPVIEPATTSNGGQAAAGASQAAAGPAIEGHLAMLLRIALLEQGRARLEKIDGYTAVFSKQERLDGEDLAIDTVVAAIAAPAAQQ